MNGPSYIPAFTPKYAAAILDYLDDWSFQLSPLGDTILTGGIEVTEGSVVLSQATLNPTSIGFWLSGGTPGETCTLATEFVTAQSRTFYALATILILPSTGP